MATQQAMIVETESTPRHRTIVAAYPAALFAEADEVAGNDRDCVTNEEEAARFCSWKDAQPELLIIVGKNVLNPVISTEEGKEPPPARYIKGSSNAIRRHVLSNLSSPR